MVKINTFFGISTHFAIMGIKDDSTDEESWSYAANQKTQAWKQLMREISSGLSLYKNMEKIWVSMKKIFDL
ncbi:L-rhamnose mutarotase [Methylobacter svalbardensis]|uniref:L-rhamnose mutarotase n=1 Tax=Methylobacter svalbardensis TaxID=3080016 RepID=UPI0030EC19CD